MGPEILNIMGLIFPLCIGVATFPTILKAVSIMDATPEEDR